MTPFLDFSCIIPKTKGIYVDAFVDEPWQDWGKRGTVAFDQLPLITWYPSRMHNNLFKPQFSYGQAKYFSVSLFCNCLKFICSLCL